MAINTRKFSQFQGPVQVTSTDIVVGLRNGQNYQFTGVGSGGGGGGSVTVIITQVAHGLTAGDWVRIDVMGDYVKAIATTAQNAEIVGTVKSVQSVDQFTLQVVGYVEAGTFAGLTPGGVYFLSDTVLGGMSLTEPVIPSEVSLPVFIAESATTGYVRQSRGVIIGGHPPLGSSNNGAPVIHTVTQPGHPFGVGDWIRVVGDTIYDYADGTTPVRAQAIGVVTAVNGNDFTLQQSGWNAAVVTQDDAANPLVASTAYYLSTTVPGQISSTKPSTVGQASRPVFISESPTDESGWVFPVWPEEIQAGTNSTSVITVNQVAHGFTVGQVIKVSAADTYALAQADSAANALPVGFVIDVIDANNFILQTAGFCDAFIPPFTPLVPPLRYFLSPTVAGGITTTEPTTAGQYSVPVLIALNGTTGYILEQRPIAATGGGGTGGILQVQSLTLRNPQNQVIGPGAWTPINNLTLAITPSNVASRVAVTVNFAWARTNFGFGTGVTTLFRLTRNGVAIVDALGVPPGGYQACTSYFISTTSDAQNITHTSINFVDSPASVAAQTYAVEVWKDGTGAPTFYLNSYDPFSTPSANFTGISTLKLEEIG